MALRTILSVLVCALLISGCGGGGGGSTGSGPSSSGGTSSSDASHGTAGCPAGNALFSVSPLPIGSVIGWEPLGAMEPPGHTFPTDHQYLYFAKPGSASSVTLPVVAPADMRIWMIYSATGAVPEYSIWFQPCAQVIGRLGSMTALSSDLASAAGPINQFCSTYSPSPGSTYTQCQAQVHYDVKAGQVIGTIASTTSAALDWWLWDSRSPAISFADSVRFSAAFESGFSEANIVAANTYFQPGIAEQIAAKIGSFDGTQHRTAAPLGGSIQIDVPGTARGYWFNPAQAYPPETYHAALAPDEVHPDTTEVISLGVSQANGGVGPGGLRANFTPVLTGQVNRAFESVTPDGNLYCYQALAENTAGQTRVVLLQLLDSTTLKIEILSPSTASCAAAQPWTFSGNAVTYKR